MDERARIPVSLPRDDPTRSYWQDLPDAAVADLRTTETLPESADVVIVGSGITGAAAAWGLQQNEDQTGRSIVMLEARQACSGATGRNGGHTKAASYRTFAHHVSTLGSTAAAAQIARLELANIREVHGFARLHGIDCDAVACDTVDIIYDAAQWEAAVAAVAAMHAALGPYDPAAEYELVAGPDAVRARFHCHATTFRGRPDPVAGAVVYPAGSLSAYKFGVGVLRLCLARGLNLQTHTPALALRREKGRDGAWLVQTPRGTIAARRVVLATNGYTAHLVPRLQGVVVPLRGQVTAQRPGRSLPAGGCLPTTYSFIYEGGYEYMVPRPPGSRFAGDIVMGGGLVRGAADEGLYEYGSTDDTALNPDVSAYLRDTTPRYFGPDWGEDDPAGRVRAEWTGIMGFTPDGFPLVGEMPHGGADDDGGGLWTASAFQGHGMVLCWMCARALVDMIEGRDANNELDSWFPRAFRITEERLAKRFQGRVSHNISGQDQGVSTE
ncbi:FAD dependent oxidoreductase [Lasiosphaeria miniovina]|uniref:FAD dependent oxidoreductase n=1 Tax=Lasiosphaeria miniovina TaxID=1954250 RepID=A0AA40DNN3_9PEZI|nr:FAD dependent oxidoreductase [Lasiosphaeria miniovina]KAK0709865.1 FAD dependent oxidoreductase [Lasiosphaeria miniovina]